MEILFAIDVDGERDGSIAIQDISKLFKNYFGDAASDLLSVKNYIDETLILIKASCLKEMDRELSNLMLSWNTHGIKYKTYVIQVPKMIHYS